MRDPELFDGVRGLTKDPKKALSSRTLTVPCGKCIGCRLARAREWSLRCMHEASMYDASSFVTLTYDDAHLPVDFGLHYRDFQLFMHRLRKRLAGAGRFLMCGEYGEQFGRPHFHAILFGCDWPDKKLIRVKPDRLYSSELLSSLWPHGFASSGDVTVQSAGYVARYATKKVTGDGAAAAYEWVSPDGEVFQREAPFLHSSLKPGIGYEWFQRYHSDAFPCDFLVYDGKKFPVPRYYTKLYEALDPEATERVLRQRRRAAKAARGAPDNSGRRLHDRGEVELLKAQAIERDLK